MFDNWWKAHEFEFAASGILIGIGLAIVGVSSLCIWIAAIRRERRKQREDGLR